MIFWGEKRAGSDVVSVNDPENPCLIIGAPGAGDWVRIPADFADAQWRGRSVQIEKIAVEKCPLNNHDHPVRMMLLPAGLAVFECNGKFWWVRIRSNA